MCNGPRAESSRSELFCLSYFSNDRYLQNGNIFPVIVHINIPKVVVISHCRYIKIKAQKNTICARKMFVLFG